MAEVLVQFDEPQCSVDGRYFVPHVCGRRGNSGLWEAWIEFHPCAGGEPASTRPETEQLTRGDLRFWAAGLTRSYLAEALQRALSPQGYRAERVPLTYAAFEAPRDAEHLVLETNSLTYPLPVIDPFVVLRQSGEYVLRQELRSLHAQQLRDIIAAFEIPDIDTTDLARTFEDALAERIVAGVLQHVGSSGNDRPVSRSRTDVM